MVWSFLTPNEFNTTKVQKKAKTTSLTSVTKWKNNLECFRAPERLYLFSKSGLSFFILTSKDTKNTPFHNILIEIKCM